MPGFFTGNADYWQIQVAADHTRDVAERHASVGNPVQPRPGWGFLQSQPKKMCGIKRVDCGPSGWNRRQCKRIRRCPGRC